jgi:hypothetical protein
MLNTDVRLVGFHPLSQSLKARKTCRQQTLSYFARASTTKGEKIFKSLAPGLV